MQMGAPSLVAPLAVPSAIHPCFILLQCISAAPKTLLPARKQNFVAHSDLRSVC